MSERDHQSQRPAGHAVDYRHRGDLANAQTGTSDATKLNTQTQNTLQSMLQGIEGIDQNKVGENILTLQNNLSASMSVTARLSQLSLVNFLAPVTG